MLVVAATDRELAHVRGVDTFVCGIGPVEAALQTARALAERRPDAVLHIGIAGARGIEPPALVLGSESVYCDVLDPSSLLKRIERIQPDPELSRACRRRCRRRYVLPIATAGKVGAGTECDVEAMEGFGVLRACALAGVPAVELRAVSNAPDEADRGKWSYEDAFVALGDAVARVLLRPRARGRRRGTARCRAGRRAVGEEENLVVRLVARLHRRAGVDGDDAARLDVDALRRIVEQERERSAQRHEDLFLHRIDVAPAAHVRRIAPHAGARLGEVRSVGDDRVASRRRAVGRLALDPLEIFRWTTSKATVRRYPQRPWRECPIPAPASRVPRRCRPGERTVGQLVAESIRFYGSRFWAVIPLGVPLAAEHVVGPASEPVACRRCCSGRSGRC